MLRRLHPPSATWEKNIAERLFSALLFGWQQPIGRIATIASIVHMLNLQAELLSRRSRFRILYSMLYSPKGLINAATIGLMATFAGVTGLLFRGESVAVGWYSVAMGLLVFPALIGWYFRLQYQYRYRYQVRLHTALRLLPRYQLSGMGTRAEFGDVEAFWMRIACWRAVCLQIGIDEEIQGRVTRTNWLPGLRGVKLRLLGQRDAGFIRRVTERVEAALPGVFNYEAREWLVQNLVDQIDHWYCRNPGSFPPFMLDTEESIAIAHWIIETRNRYSATTSP